VPARFDLFGKDYADAYGRGDPGVSIDEQMLAPALRLRARQLVVVTILLRNRPV
jgi:type IV pilus assembly protein PilW